MTALVWLQGASFVAWGLAAGHGILGCGLAALWLLPQRHAPWWPVGEQRLPRLVDLSSLALLLAATVLLVAQGLPRALLSLAGWLPVILFPLALAAARGDARLRLRHVAYSLRRSRHAAADQALDVAPAYLALTLLAGSVLAAPQITAAAVLAALFLSGLWTARRPPRRLGGRAFVIAAGVALAAAGALYAGLERGQQALEEWIVDSLGGGPTDPERSQTRIGDLGRVKLSERIVWRVEQAGAARVPLLLRDGVFTHFDGRRWLARPSEFAAADIAPPAAPALRLHGDSREGTAIVPLPADAGGAQALAGRLERNEHGIVRIVAAPSRILVEVGTAPAARAAPTPSDLALTAPLRELLPRLPQIAALAEAPASARVAGLAAWFAEHFRYTLWLGDEARGGRELDRFLLADRAGHCEYFASATVVLLRALGVPARYVTGYSVQEYSRLERRFVVRQRHAHAWAEAYVDGRWIEVDTTPAGWLAAEEQAAPRWQPLLDFGSWIGRGIGDLRPPGGSGAAWLAAALGAAVLYLWRLRRGRQRELQAQSGTPNAAPATPASAALAGLEAEFAARGLGRPPGETPRAWLARLAATSGSVDAAQLANAAGIVERHYAACYGTKTARERQRGR